jgi:trk system potassium uptake protein TrkA
MQIVIVGAGEVGYSLAEALLKNKHQVTIIEREPARCNGVVKLLNTVVIQGDGTNISTLADAELDKADILIALTGRDQDNLIACQLASKKFHVSRTIARVTRPQNKKLFEQLGGVDTAVSTTEIISSIVEEEVSLKNIVTLLNFKDANVAIVEVAIGEDSPARDKHIVDLDLPEDCVLICIFRGNEVVFPHGLTSVKTGDRILSVTTKKNKTLLKNLMVGEASSST